ncbi:LytS/YhcK type 5TM receptor domain-containing protein [Gymnodinialimonas sp. 2305UL16-5]|uniref:LytS/YhcK type 5TM receptor domain-containing protein n=1 Tax=Gymnodinialimonas mytili TaxID=3126503 RepID=UPI0030B33F36
MTFSAILDFVASLAVLALLAESYGALRRRLAGRRLAPLVIGSLFGLMAALQMMNPLSPVEGLIIDMRAIPIALAGAFLGWRGLLPCLAIAVGARLGIGGVGVVAALPSMAIAGLAGMIWSRKMAHHETRNFSALLCLALAMSTHLLAAVVLPRDLAVWFYTIAAGPILALNLIAVPLIGGLLEREHRRILRENQLKAALSTDPGSGLLTGPAFVRDVTNAFAAHPFGTFAGLLVFNQQRSFVQRLLGLRGLSRQRLLEIRKATDDLLEHSGLAGFTAEGSVFVPLNEDEVARAKHISKAMERVLVAQPDNPGQRLLALSGRLVSDSLDVIVLSTPDPAVFLRLAERAALSARPDWLGELKRRDNEPMRLVHSSPLRREKIFDPAEHNALFAKADYLMSRSNQ